jgi:hypothetical protein
MSGVTKVVWVCRDRVTTMHIKGLVVGLEQLGALDYAEIHILPVSEDRGVHMPPGNWRGPDGSPIAGGYVFTLDTLPPHGLLFVGSDEIS